MVQLTVHVSVSGLPALTILYRLILMHKRTTVKIVIFLFFKICSFWKQGWANIEKLARSNIWIYSKKCNMLERILEYSTIIISDIQIFVYWSFNCQIMTPDTWHRKPDICHTGMWTLSQNCRSLALMVWEFKDSN